MLSETYDYDLLGNLRVKAGVTYDYPAAGQPRPHAPIRVGGQPDAYDANGNLVSGGGRTYTWNGWNQLASVSQRGVSETYTYDAEGARVTLARREVRGTRVSGAERRARGHAPGQCADAPYPGPPPALMPPEGLHPPRRPPATPGCRGWFSVLSSRFSAAGARGGRRADGAELHRATP
ncbi:MAG: hypothetical protein RMJ55_17070 [Roseiflexaceae bacterium]|nr:hypothetical protein [Roseiflexaceae bacterium]